MIQHFSFNRNIVISPFGAAHVVVNYKNSHSRSWMYFLMLGEMYSIYASYDHILICKKFIYDILKA